MLKSLYQFRTEVEATRVNSLRGKNVVIVHPAWHSCGTSAVVAGQARVYRNLGAKVTTVAMCVDLDYGLNRIKAEALFQDATPDIVADKRYFVGVPKKGLATFDFFRGVLWPLARGNHPITMTGLAQRSDLPPDLRGEKIDIVHCNHFFCMPLAERIAAGRCPIFLETHDVQARQYVLRNKGSWFLPPYPAFEELLSRELSWLERADLLIHLNSEEYNFFRDRLPNMRHELIYPAIKDVSIDRVGDEGVVIAGANYPNVQSIQWLLAEVYSLAKSPPILIAGGVKDDFQLRAPALYGANRSLFTGHVTDLQEIYNRAKYIILPTVSGNGLSIKSVEALASGLPIVATTHAFRGMNFDIALCKNIFIADSPEAFAAQIELQAAREPTSAEQRRNSDTRAVYLAKFSDQSLAVGLAALLS
ncbi:MAG: glycosyltransferase [Beijerinckiaceae bacterium]|nr:glycosyltransferase [Beijerinckiaceae bacterium]